MAIPGQTSQLESLRHRFLKVPLPAQHLALIYCMPLIQLLAWRNEHREIMITSLQKMLLERLFSIRKLCLNPSAFDPTRSFCSCLAPYRNVCRVVDFRLRQDVRNSILAGPSGFCKWRQIKFAVGPSPSSASYLTPRL